MKKRSEYARGHADGMNLALKILRKGGEKALASEIRKRGYTGIESRETLADLEEKTDSIITWCLKRIFIVSVAAVHDAYGIGPKRMQAYFDEFDKATRLLMKERHGGALWTDFADKIRETYGVELSANTEGVLVKKVNE